MKVSISKSKNETIYYLSKSVRIGGKTTTKTIEKIGTYDEIKAKCGEMDPLDWAKQYAAQRTAEEKKTRSDVIIKYSSSQLIEKNVRRSTNIGYLFLQDVYYSLGLHKICSEISTRHKFDFDLNDILSMLVYSRILAPGSKKSSLQQAQAFLEPPKCKLHQIYRGLEILAQENDLFQSQLYKNSENVMRRNKGILYYDCTNYYFEIEEEDDFRKYGKSKEHRPNPIVQMGLFMDRDGIPLAFSIFPGNENEQPSLKPLETKVIQQMGCDKFIYCSDAGLASQANRRLNHTANRSFIVTQSIRKLKSEYKEDALKKTGFKRLSDRKPVDIENLENEDSNELYYKEIPYISGDIDQLLIITYSPKFAEYQKRIRDAQVERAEAMIKSGKLKKNRKNPNDPARFVEKLAVTKDGEKADIKYYLDEDKIANEEMYDGLYAVCTDLIDDDVREILKVSEGRWQIEECFRIMKTDFSARPVYLQRDERITAHFLICFLALLSYRLLEKKLNNKYTCEEILTTLKKMNFASIEEQGFMPLYRRTKLTDKLHDISGFNTDYQFITKRKMKEIQKISKGR